MMGAEVGAMRSEDEEKVYEPKKADASGSWETGKQILPWST